MSGFKDGDSVSTEKRVFVNSGMLRKQPSDQLDVLEKEKSANMELDGLRDKHFAKGYSWQHFCIATCI